MAVLTDLPEPKLRVRLTAPRALAFGGEVTFIATAEPVSPDNLVVTEP
jgi:hypothetical protein